ncbi:trans-sulfuration enzyme family protein [Limosilactobacillus vaginalis]|uniref:trans-sulfuration enzyme family protein n=1 Tax=Limosilactobacillus vaginalis TaxID=1633 RepID=UPI0022A9999F|nr:PLP-dependent aspartate aminotransferase family protein [Limosilactobacillus vaginalis]MCZ2465043.1 PLP-dependent aspartate aminotransferase family protein [Limosilactobacillus vaginalis]
MTRFDTKLVHAPAQHDNNTGAVTTPIYKATTFAYPEIGAPVKDDYSRSGNPTRRALEEQLAALEEGTAGFAFSSGMAAIHAALAIFKQGDHLIVGNQIYGGTFRLLHQFFERWGLKITAVDTRNLAAIEAAIQPNTKAIYFEPVTNPLLQVTSVQKVAALAQQHHLLTIVDNTFLSPYLLQPLTLGADIVIHSATKYLSGHSDVSAGAVIVKDRELAERVYFIQNALGSILSPEDSNELARGIKTLSLRLGRQIANVKELVNYLQGLGEVKKIYYPGIKGLPGYQELRQEAKGVGGVFSFELTESVDPVKFVNNLRLFKLAVSLGAVESLVELPSKMSHAELSPEEQLAAGIKPGLIRMAVGIEDFHDQIADIQQAIAKSRK